MNELSFSYADMYPTFSGVETSALATPEVDDQDALNEDVKVAEGSSVTESPKKKIFLAILILALLIVFFGGGK